ncbi:MAG: hypothetical protein KA173_12480 [Rhodoferax sp.]|nr:hypothetical protein [Rhodoferax sp.]MBP7492004.1 hypothetical protein [Rhodoferax sp.]
MALSYLDFDTSEDELGWGNFDAMASVLLAQRPALQAEIDQVLKWANANFPQQQGPLEAGGEWDYDLQARPDTLTQGPQRYIATLSISGTPQFCTAFKHHFALD